MKSIVIIIIGSIVFLSTLNEPCYARTSSVYWGTWKTQVDNRDITLIIKMRNISWKINEREIRNVQYEFLYGQLPATFSFLVVYARDGDEEHILRLILGNEGNDGKPTPLNRLKGYYEHSKLLYMQMKEDHGGTQETFLYPVDFFKACGFKETCD